MSDHEASLLPRADSIPGLEDFLALKAEDYPPYCGTIGAAIIPRSEILFPHGNPRSLKTWSFLSLLLCVASGRPWLNMFPCEQARVLYIQGDGGRLKWQERIHKLMRGMGLSPRDLRDWFHTDMRNGRVLAFRDHIDGLIEACGDWHPQIATFDPFARFLSGELNENDNRDMSIFVSRVEQFPAAWTDCSLVFPHHDAKNSAQEGGGRMRGASTLWAAGSTCRVRSLSRTKSELDFVLKDYESPAPFVVEVEVGTEIATVRYLGPAESEERREKTASVLVALREATEPMTFKDLSEASNVTVATVRLIIADCLDRELVEEAAPKRSGSASARTFRLIEGSI